MLATDASAADEGAAQGQGGLADCHSASGDPTLNGPARVPAAESQVYKRSQCGGALEAEEARQILQRQGAWPGWDRPAWVCRCLCIVLDR